MELQQAVGKCEEKRELVELTQRQQGMRGWRWLQLVREERRMVLKEEGKEGQRRN